MPVLVTMTNTIRSRSVCSKCGTVAKSGKHSCCGRGGSWFRNCGIGVNTNFDHTWFEGLRVCKIRAQFKRTIDWDSNAARQRNSSNNIGTGNSKAVVSTANLFALTSGDTSPLIPARTRRITPENASMGKRTAEFDETTTNQLNSICVVLLYVVCTIWH